jgi:RNA polymerase sigma-70 factor (ECF subfamily)
MAANANEAVERAARDSYGRLLAFLSARSRDIAAAEDALADAFGAALADWPTSGVPARPEAWLLTAARRRLIDAARRHRVRELSQPTLLQFAEEAEQRMSDPAGLADERLKLLFVCAHPEIDSDIRTPLMLQTVLGLDAGRIASAFCISPAAMARRLTRAKVRIREAAIPFEVPEPRELGDRLEPVLEAIYACYGRGWDDVAGGGSAHTGLSAEAIYLGHLVATLLPDEPEACGLVALMLHCEARRAARRDRDGDYVPLAEQDSSLWSQPMAREAEEMLARAASTGRIGRFQLEAAIQSVHAQRAVTGRTDWEAVALLYEGLVQLAPTVGALVGRAAALAQARGAATGLAMLEELPPASVASYQPFWALFAYLLEGLGRVDEARDAYDRAIGLSDDAAVRAFLIRRAENLSGPQRRSAS